MKIYICGKVTGEDRLACFSKFEMIEKLLKKSGHEPVNPMRLVPAECDWTTAMKVYCIPELLKCDALIELPDARSSRGGMLEMYIADQLKLDRIRI